MKTEQIQNLINSRLVRAVGKKPWPETWENKRGHVYYPELFPVASFGDEIVTYADLDGNWATVCWSMNRDRFLPIMLLKDGTRVFDNSPEMVDEETLRPGYGSDAEYDADLDDWTVSYADQDGGEISWYWSCKDDCLERF